MHFKINLDIKIFLLTIRCLFHGAKNQILESCEALYVRNRSVSKPIAFLSTLKIAFLICLFFNAFDVSASQFSFFEKNIFFVPDTVKSISNDTLKKDAELLTVPVDSLFNKKEDSIKNKKKPDFVLESIIKYSSRDTIWFDLDAKKIWLYGNAKIEYEDILLKSKVMMVDFDKKTLTGWSGYDSTDGEHVVVDFTQGELNFKSEYIEYNFDSKKGLIKDVLTQEGEGYLHGSVVKRIDDKVSNIGSGAYTTCNLPKDPHFALRYTKAKVITGDKIITGPAYLEVEQVPFPLALPFGLFPNKKGRSSGIIIPQYGESSNRGFFLENGGYYFGLNEYLDLKLVGDIYTRGSWALKPTMNYKKRYKYSGGFNFNYAITVLGVKGTSDYSRQRDFFVNWHHNQDPKARPNTVFSASVQAGSSSYNQFNPGSVNDYLNNNFASSISYDIRFGNFGNLTLSGRHNQNITTKMVTITLPDASFNVNRFYPLKKKIQKGKQRWYENINLSYNMDMRNMVDVPDSLLFEKDIFKRMQNGIQHRIPVNASFKVLKYLTWNNTFNYNEKWYFRSIEKNWIGDTIIQGNDTINGFVKIDTVNGFKAARDYNFSTSLSTTFYGMKQISKGPVRAIRHVVYPSVGFNFAPNFGDKRYGYYKNVQTDALGNTEQYSVFGGSHTFSPIFGYPGNQRIGAIQLGLKNNLEIKVPSKKDTINGVRKVVLLENLSFNTSYNLAKDSIRWSPLRITANTTLFNKIRITFNGNYDYYAIDSTGNQINKFQYQVNKKLLRFMQSDWNLNFNYTLRPKAKKDNSKTTSTTNESSEELEDIKLNPHNYIDWDNPWSLSIDYRLGYVSSYLHSIKNIDRKLMQTINVSGDLSITQKWKFTFATGYDIKEKGFTFTQLNIYRDLHCWEMRLNWVPYGQLKSWNFQINAKSSLLQDLKLTRKKDFRDNLQL